MYTTNAKVRPPRQNVISTVPQCKWKKNEKYLMIKIIIEKKHFVALD